MNTPSLQSQIKALEAVIAIACDGLMKPKGEQLALLRQQAKAGVESLRKTGGKP